jgi:hypothetical protein
MESKYIEEVIDHLPLRNNDDTMKFALQPNVHALKYIREYSEDVFDHLPLPKIEDTTMKFALQQNVHALKYIREYSEDVFDYYPSRNNSEYLTEEITDYSTSLTFGGIQYWMCVMNDKIETAMEKSDDEFKHAEPAKETRVLKKIEGEWTLVDTIMTHAEFLELISEIRSVNQANDILIGMA